MRPLIWTEWWAFLAAIVPFVWLLSIEVGTSRRQSAEVGDVEIDVATGRRFDVAVAISVVGAVTASIFLHRLTIEPPMAALLSGIALMVAAIGLSWWARRHLGRFHRNVLTIQRDHELIETGPYRWVRHPLYLATMLAFTGIGLAAGNWLSLALLAAVPAAALVHRIGVEEAMLGARFGPGYQSFCRTRARLVPFVW